MPLTPNLLSAQPDYANLSTWTVERDCIGAAMRLVDHCGPAG